MSSRVLIAPDKFKGTFTAQQVAEAVAAGLSDRAELDLCPLADGGDGTAELLRRALGGSCRQARTVDVLGRSIEAGWVLLDDGRTAAIDVAAASGLARLAPDELDPLGADSEGTGRLIAAAVEEGAEQVLLACGGSACTDGGVGALRALGVLGRPGALTAPGAFGAGSGPIGLTCLCDVSDPFEGALRFAPQKGATADDLDALRLRLERLRTELPHDPGRLPFTGAAGGLAGGLWAHGASLRSGSDHVLSAFGFDRRLEAAGTVITGEGRLDATSFSGKVAGAVAERAARRRKPCLAIVGEDQLEPGPQRSRFAAVAVAPTLAAISAAGRELLAARSDG